MSEQAASESGRRVPLWVLNAREEKEARTNLKNMAYKNCDEYVKAMADCAKQNGLKCFPACDQQRADMRQCLLFYQTDHYLDVERDKIVQKRIARLEEMVNKQKS
ncbi:uncharacterized protein GVI51_D01969 [Nakaseomyces glabratus]|uniref:COX assembly mitochondrial protein n=2 Tax=Candida glabrata TaxID=5478 RepID=Q6FW91_CANGA|nr:uncharacterized protein CAGL0D02046g [Nakaseomyces glabratus]KAH7589772.1 Cytochrome c oxidase biogenesis protein Cmc1 like [Nakaseomyces glabratus]KAH7590853.1 Cytochrome c oxidase biogenesis protein Cmc1 like [Nakaseomyces glabratus]KAH7596589.1 Cytochrome c oxidase biogenesis protein Cmc1 like [Nakaseomyces glabratus]KAH7606445.1 Cytochrome c oxidase biogenesis protein Cmc1 like [Nakaseomyces glabratus]KAH7608239.1 Cytochrome c oxidase biogenesis protein Cmc1 like [Nakaseomyces glabratus|eukprot:XP_445503.1 uncharacterized protein CAGL0D02046g [[Candida] glabrata]